MNLPVPVLPFAAALVILAVLLAPRRWRILAAVGALIYVAMVFRLCGAKLP